MLHLLTPLLTLPSEQVVGDCSRRRSAHVEERDGAVESAFPAVSTGVSAGRDFGDVAGGGHYQSVRS